MQENTVNSNATGKRNTSVLEIKIPALYLKLFTINII